MASMTYTATAKDSLILELPEEAQELGIKSGDKVSVQIESENALRKDILAMTTRTPEQIAEAQLFTLATYKPRRPLPPGQTFAEAVSGKWPGQETDEQIQTALDELS